MSTDSCCILYTHTHTHLFCLENGDQSVGKPRAEALQLCRVQGQGGLKGPRDMRSKTKEDHLPYQWGKWHPVTWAVARVTSFEEAIFTALLGYGRGLWLDFQYPFHPKSLMATPPPDRWMAQEWPYDPILANATWGSVFWRAFGKDFSILRKQVQERMASPLFLDIAVSGSTPGIATAWLRKTSTPKRKKERDGKDPSCWSSALTLWDWKYER